MSVLSIGKIKGLFCEMEKYSMVKMNGNDGKMVRE